MGSVWLGSLPLVLRNAGLEVDVSPGWETRSRSTGGYDEVRAIQVHHTASGTTPVNDMAYMWRNAPTRPIGALYLARDGRWTVGAAGATNTSGSGGPLTTSRGTIPKDAANRYVISVEAANKGDGEVWTDAQLHSYVRGVAALAKAYLGLGLGEIGDIHAHHEWTSRKIDPAGQSWYATGRNKWDMRRFRADVEIANNPLPPPTPPSPGDDMLYIAKPTFAGANDNTAWLAVFESGDVRRAMNSDVTFAATMKLPFIDLDSAEQHAYMVAKFGI